MPGRTENIQTFFEPPVAEAQSFYQEGGPGEKLTLKPHRQAQARFTTGAGGLELLSTEAYRLSLLLFRARSGFYRRPRRTLPAVWETEEWSGLPETGITAPVVIHGRSQRQLDWGFGTDEYASPKEDAAPSPSRGRHVTGGRRSPYFLPERPTKN